MDSAAYIEKLEQQNSALLKQVESLTRQVENLTEMIVQMRKDKYGPSSEKTASILDNQLSMPQVFNEVELEADDTPEPAKITSQGKVRVNPNSKREFVLKDVPVKEVICEGTPESLVCPQCGGPLRAMGTKVVRTELEYIPAQLSVIKYIQTSYECPKCKRTDKPYITSAFVPRSLLPHSLASASSVANVIYQKYVNAVPLYRQEKDWSSLGVDLGRGTMANWVIRCSEEYFKPLNERLRGELILRDIVHVDETPFQVLKEPGKKPTSKSYMWVYRTGNDGKDPIVLYDYRKSRSGDNAVEFLKGFEGYIHSDGYSGYNKLKNVVRCGCWAHLRRKFVEALPGKDCSVKSNAQIGVEYCDRLFGVEASLKDMSPEERQAKRFELERPIINEFWNWIENLVVLPGSAIGKAREYALNQQPYMENYLLDGRLDISNNAAENAIRPFTVGRKNWLFADTVNGAEASAAVYSIIETAKANGLNTYKYIEYLLKNLPDSGFQADPEILNKFMPWNETVQAECR